jgi:hypothetical protein
MAPLTLARPALLVAALATITTGAPRVARAEAPVDDAATAAAADAEAARGEDEARRSNYAAAIDHFVAADRLRPRARHACLIGLAYLRRSMWSHAEVFLDRCRRRASAADPLPEWMPAAEEQLATQLATAPVTALTVRVLPAGVDARVRIELFGADQQFDPRVFYLPAGGHRITVEAPGFASATETVELFGKGQQEVEVTLVPVVPAPPPPKLAPAPARSRLARPLLYGGGAALVLGGVLHGLAFQARGRLADATTEAEYDEHEGRFDLTRAGAIGLYALAAGAITTGLVLELRGGSERRAAGLAVGAVPLPGGGLVSVALAR